MTRGVFSRPGPSYDFSNMPYPRSVVLESCILIGRKLKSRGEFDHMVLRWELDHLAGQNRQKLDERCARLFEHLRDSPNETFEGRLVSDLVVEYAVARYFDFEESHAFEDVAEDSRFRYALERAGYQLHQGGLRRALPEVVDLPASDDEVHALLKKHKLTVTLGHLDQAITAHSRGDWAAANSQVRSCLESLFDEIAYLTIPAVPRGPNEGEARREALASRQPPLLMTELNEWGNHGKNLVNGAFKRLHPQGAHPGLSDEEDSTFRLHLVLLLARLFLRRLDADLR